MNSYSNYNPYSTTSYGSHGPANGGGFYGGGGGGGSGGGAGFDDNAGGGAGGFGSPGSASKRAGGNTLRPVTIKQILDAQQAHPDAEFRIDDVEVSQLTFVAIVRTVAMQSTNVTYRMEDGTGMIDVKQWIDAEQGAANTGLRTDTYVRVTGQLKSFHNKRHIGAHHIRPIKDHNEVVFHLLEATSIHLYNTRGPPDGSKPVQSYNQGQAMEGVIPGNMPIGKQGADFSHLEPLQREIMMLVHNAPPSNEGVHVQTIAQTIHASSASVLQAVEQLATEGLLYTTIDDDHVKSTDAEQ